MILPQIKQFQQVWTWFQWGSPLPSSTTLEENGNRAEDYFEETNVWKKWTMTRMTMRTCRMIIIWLFYEARLSVPGAEEFSAGLLSAIYMRKQSSWQYRWSLRPNSDDTRAKTFDTSKREGKHANIFPMLELELGQHIYVISPFGRVSGIRTGRPGSGRLHWWLTKTSPGKIGPKPRWLPDSEPHFKHFIGQLSVWEGGRG